MTTQYSLPPDFSESLWAAIRVIMSLVIGSPAPLSFDGDELMKHADILWHAALKLELDELPPKAGVNDE